MKKKKRNRREKKKIKEEKEQKEVKKNKERRKNEYTISGEVQEKIIEAQQKKDIIMITKTIRNR